MLRSSVLRTLAVGVFAIPLASCGGGPVRRINPPVVTIQELGVRPDGQWNLRLRVQNFSTVPMTIDTIESAFEIEDRPAGQLYVRPALEIPGQAADVVETNVTPGSAAQGTLKNAPGSGSVGYRLVGHVTTRDPDKSFEIRYESRLSPVPGLPDTYR